MTDNVKDGLCFICHRAITVEEVLLEEVIDPDTFPTLSNAGWNKPYHKECYEHLREKYAGEGYDRSEPEGSEHNP